MSTYLECDICGHRRELYGWISDPDNHRRFDEDEVRKRVGAEREWYSLRVRGTSKTGTKTDSDIDICDQCINKTLKKIGLGEVRQ